MSCMLFVGSIRNDKFLIQYSYQQTNLLEVKHFKVSANQKQELLMASMFFFATSICFREGDQNVTVY